MALTTFGVGYSPLAPGTWGSAVGVLIYLAVWVVELRLFNFFIGKGLKTDQFTACIYAANSIALVLFCFLGIWASNRVVKISNLKDPQKIVVDEVMGQLITLVFIPFAVSWYFILAGFLLFRLFDIWKPYPINSLEQLPAGLGVCADDILAGIYGGICLSIIYAIYLLSI